MSKRTNAINECLEKLDKYQMDLGNYIFKSGNDDRELSDIEFGLKQELRTLRFWIDSLYKYNGKSTSILKKSASKENGKKGGRPPKDVTEARRRALELENTIIPDLEKEMMNSDSNEQIRQNEQDISKAKTELDECKNKIDEYKRSKELNDSLSRL